MANPVPPYPHTGPGAASEGANQVNSVLPGVVADAGSIDPSATTVGGSISNAMAQMAEMRSDAESPAGTFIGDLINLPEKNY
jgi:hypothetical protein